MDYTDVLINIIDKAQKLYEWFVRLFGHLLDWFERFKEFILELAHTIREKLNNTEEIDHFLRNYGDSEHIFI